MNTRIIGFIIVLLGSSLCFAGQGSLFTVKRTAKSLTITPTANQYYPKMGIKLTTANVVISGCTRLANGYCVFPASKKEPASLPLNSTIPISGIICLNGVGPYSCQRFSTANAPPPSCTTGANGECGVFLSSAQYTGNLGGLSGANKKCQTLAANAHLPGKYHAWLSDDTTAASDNIEASFSLAYVLAVSKTLVAEPGQLLFDILQHPINETENNSVPAGNLVFTGTDWNGDPVLGANCLGWTSSITTDGPVVGDANDVFVAWTYVGFLPSQCQIPTSIYCFEVPS